MTTETPAREAIGSTPLERCQELLAQAIVSARALGLATADPERTLDAVERRLGFPGDTYVLALVGGTGVGKSSLLNVLAGSPISTVSAQRPTTSQPIAWIPAEARREIEPLLDWLGVYHVREHEGGSEPVAIIDLPDVDSIVGEHRAVVEELLPKIDAVAWVTDPEKYADAVLHDEFLRRWVPRLERQVLVINKTDRLQARAEDELRRDADRVLRMAASERRPRVITTSAIAPAGADPLVEWLTEESEGKRVIRQRAAAAVVSAASDLADLAAGGGTAAGTIEEPLPLFSTSRRADVLKETSAEVLRLVDLRQLERRATEAVRSRARARAGGPLGLLRMALDALSGRQRRLAEPRAFLVRWRERGSLGAATSRFREAMTEALRTAPPSIRGAVAPLADRSATETAIGEAVDRAILATPDVRPSSRLWSLLGPIQSLIGVGILLAVIWLVVAALVRTQVDATELPLFGHVPIPLVILVTLIVATLALGRATDLHARVIGARWARRLASEVETRVNEQVRGSAFAAVDELEASRRELWRLAVQVRADCGERPDALTGR